MLETIYIARHGFRLSWETSVWNAPTGTPRDPPLSAHGVDQANELASWLKTLSVDERPQRIYSSYVGVSRQGAVADPQSITIISPLYRCLQTSTPVAEALGWPILVEHGLAEWYLPVRRGLHPRSLPASELIEWIPRIAPTAHSSLLYPSQRGETPHQLHERTTQVLTLLINHINSSPDPPKTIILFTHAATLIALGRTLIDDRECFVKAATCSVSRYELVKGKQKERDGLGRWEIKMNGDTSFLKGGEERHWDFSFVEAYEEDGILEDGTDAPLLSDQYKTVDNTSSSTPAEVTNVGTKSASSSNEAIGIMFTGLVEILGTVSSIHPTTEFEGFSFVISNAQEILDDCKLGDSFAVNGCCLTVTEWDTKEGWFKVGLSNETLQRTDLGSIKVGSRVNLERAMAGHGRFGGHFVQGHVDTVAQLLSITPDGDSIRLLFSLPLSFYYSLIPKGYIALDGTSLTLTHLSIPREGDEYYTDGQTGLFGVMLVQHTQSRTVVAFKQVGDKVAVECDVVGKGVEAIVRNVLQSGGEQNGALEAMIERAVEKVLLQKGLVKP
ncbi:BZ3500_MvSof-1268-A1-R1_Chr1-2g01461 [Microbotryum saponariae]|uniref:BZ3500_MvSof-1268-A1-R1_Chr1-2g01461 protein n=1 Tax=Microbotryum saponariae TaxID=289078 RepID=A0A2X0KTJ5_9BASI|nr:BZ3500_MvSof-1268-A1-R1_Chr1-2g01461 [Microbotryum saponariae]SCZ97469.1 BZ3501_MvSof-1269-A2-R1_Chr1-2g01060 [Microbotryum saponariae]